jgi:hypothetical protein
MSVQAKVRAPRRQTSMFKAYDPEGRLIFHIEYDIPRIKKEEFYVKKAIRLMAQGVVDQLKESESD